MKNTFVLIALALIIFFNSNTLSAQNLVEPAHKQGYYLGISGYGSLELSNTSNEVIGPWAGPGFNIRLGESLNQYVDIGIGGGAFYGYGDDYKIIWGNFSFELTLKPTQYLFVQFGVGLGFSDFTRMKTDMEPITGRIGSTYTFLVGYDFFPWQKNSYQSGGFSVAPVLGIALGPSDPTSTHGVFGGIMLTWWTGLPKNRLILPVEKAFE